MGEHPGGPLFRQVAHPGCHDFDARRFGIPAPVQASVLAEHFLCQQMGARRVGAAAAQDFGRQCRHVFVRVQQIPHTGHHVREQATGVVRLDGPRQNIHGAHGGKGTPGHHARGAFQQQVGHFTGQQHNLLVDDAALPKIVAGFVHGNGGRVECLDTCSALLHHCRIYLGGAAVVPCPLIRQGVRLSLRFEEKHGRVQHVEMKAKGIPAGGRHGSRGLVQDANQKSHALAKRLQEVLARIRSQGGAFATVFTRQTRSEVLVHKERDEICTGERLATYRTNV
jgi:hypothetical protein